MTLLQQILWGSLYLSACVILEAALLVACASALEKGHHRWAHLPKTSRNGILILTALAFILLAHTAQVWIWSTVFILTETIGDWNTAIYFSLVTYTTLGYGDIVLGPALRIFGAFAAVAGLLGFGISTAFLVALMGRIFGFMNSHPPGD
jgi:hypothetical protein